MDRNESTFFQSFESNPYASIALLSKEHDRVLNLILKFNSSYIYSFIVFVAIIFEISLSVVLSKLKTIFYRYANIMKLFNLLYLTLMLVYHLTKNCDIVNSYWMAVYECYVVGFLVQTFITASFIMLGVINRKRLQALSATNKDNDCRRLSMIAIVFLVSTLLNFFLPFGMKINSKSYSIEWNNELTKTGWYQIFTIASLFLRAILIPFSISCEYAKTIRKFSDHVKSKSNLMTSNSINESNLNFLINLFY